MKVPPVKTEAPWSSRVQVMSTVEDWQRGESERESDCEEVVTLEMDRKVVAKIGEEQTRSQSKKQVWQYDQQSR